MFASKHDKDASLHQGRYEAYVDVDDAALDASPFGQQLTCVLFVTADVGVGLKAVWFGAEALGKVIGRGQQAPDAASSSEGSQQMTRDEWIAAIKADYDESYFVSGQVRSVPAVHVTGLLVTVIPPSHAPAARTASRPNSASVFRGGECNTRHKACQYAAYRR